MNMNINLTQRERVLIAILYLVLLAVVFRMIGGDFDFLLGNKSSDNVIWFFSGALMIVMGKYIVEPYFTKPSDAIANSVAVLVSLLGIVNKDAFLGYQIIFYYALSVLLLSILAITFKDSQRNSIRNVSRFSYWIVEIIGNARFMFSVIYLSASYSYFSSPTQINSFITVIVFWIILLFFDVVGLTVKRIARLLNFFSKKAGKELGTAIGCENPFLYRVEMDLIKNRNDVDIKYGDLVAIETGPNIGSIGMVINKKYLLSKRWLSIYLFRDENDNQIKIDLRSKKLTNEPKSIFTQSNVVFTLNHHDLSIDERNVIENNYLYKSRGSFVGYVTTGSNINTINFTVIRDGYQEDERVSEGVVLTTTIHGKGTLYQVINGNTKEEHLENFDTHGYVVGIARKLGQYDYVQKTLDVSKWVPSIYSPLFFIPNGAKDETRRKQMAVGSIGHLPNTDLEIPIKDIDSVVTHNTAILGILGIGKSCLSFELIKRIAENGTKIFCLDITNQYYSDKGLFPYIAKRKIQFDLSVETKKTLKTSKDDRTKIVEGNPQASGNMDEYITALDQDIKKFVESEQQVKVYNPDLHPVSKGQAFRNTSLEDLTIAEKTRTIAERIFIHAMNSGISEKAKYALVFEEAHSLVPEWNSVANEGDKNATNGTAKVILQGRKYGLGSIVVTQRTANVSKSILNQCNTIFAMRVFDDTGKGFLSNYIGEDYADTLATLEERHAIAIGKGLRLKQPVIIELNNKEDVIIHSD